MHIDCVPLPLWPSTTLNIYLFSPIMCLFLWFDMLNLCAAWLSYKSDFLHRRDGQFAIFPSSVEASLFGAEPLPRSIHSQIDQVYHWPS